MEKLVENLGKLGKDKVTGFEGIITAAAVHLYGCNTYCVRARCKDNTRDDKCDGWYDEGRIEIIGEGVNPKEVQTEKSGGEDLPVPSDV